MGARRIGKMRGDAVIRYVFISLLVVFFIRWIREEETKRAKDTEMRAYC